MIQLLRFPHMGININFDIDDSLKEIIEDFRLTYWGFLDQKNNMQPYFRMYRKVGSTVSVFFEHEGETEIRIEDAMAYIDNFVYAQVNVDPNILALHAGSVNINGNAVLFVGRTMAGKSTLASYLSFRGCQYYTDDIALVNVDRRELIPFPKTIMLREDTVRLFEREHIYIPVLGRLAGSQKKRTVVHPEPSVSSIDLISVEAVIFLELGSDNKGLFSYAPSLHKMAGILYHPKDLWHQLALCGRLTQVVRFYRLRYDNLDEAYSLLSNNIL